MRFPRRRALSQGPRLRSPHQACLTSLEETSSIRRLRSPMRRDKIGLRLQVSLFLTKAVNRLWNNFRRILILMPAPRENSRLLMSTIRMLLSREIVLLEEATRKPQSKKRVIITVRITLRIKRRPNLIPLRRHPCQSQPHSKPQSQSQSLSRLSLLEPHLWVPNLRASPSLLCLPKRRNELL